MPKPSVTSTEAREKQWSGFKIDTNQKQPALQTENLTLSYINLTAVDRISLRAFFNEILFLLGPNGAGKTSLIKMICGLLHPDSGSLHYFDKSSRKAIPLSRTRIGYCPQRLSIWLDLTPLEQLVFLSRLYGLPADKSDRQSHLLLNSLGLTEKKDVPAGNLSGGMQRCLNLALAMVHDPEILILDEPFVGLDIQNRFHIRQVLRSFAKSHGKSLIISTHNFDEADKLADRVIVMDEGAVIKTHSVSPVEVGGRNRSLEDLFIELTGKGVEK